MSERHKILDVLEKYIHQIHEISKASVISIHVGIRSERLFMTSQLGENDKARTIATLDDGRVFAGASIFKAYIAAGAVLAIEIFSVSGKDEHIIFQRLQGALDRTFTEVFNEHSDDVKIAALAGNPTVRQLLVHFKSTRNINHLFLSPDGNPLMSDEDFLSIIPEFTKDTDGTSDYGLGWSEYTNSGCILVAMLLQVVSKMSLQDFLSKYIFGPIGMTSTFMAADKLEKLPNGILAQPHTVSSNGDRKTIIYDTIPYLANTVEVAVAGGYLSAADLGKFFTAVQGGLYGIEALYGQEEYSEFNREFVESFLRGMNYTDGELSGYTPCGLLTHLNNSLPGSHSLNRAISPASESINEVLGKQQGKSDVNVYYLAGSATGWASTAYFSPTKEVFVIVFTDTSAPLDPSDLIARLCLQEIFDLRPSKIGDRNFTCRPKGWQAMSQKQIYRAHYVELAARMFEENSLEYRKFEEADSMPDTPLGKCPNVCGTFLNLRMRQSLLIINVGGKLLVRLKGSQHKESGLMRFVWNGEVFRMCSLQGNNSHGFAIDRFTAWRNLEFQVEKKDNVVTCLSREGLNGRHVDRFVRTSKPN